MDALAATRAAGGHTTRQGSSERGAPVVGTHDGDGEVRHLAGLNQGGGLENSSNVPNLPGSTMKA